MDLAPTQVVDDQYRILRRVGSGAHGVVYKARDLASRQEVGLKFLDASLAQNPTYIERLRREALAMTRLRGTAAVQVHDLRQSKAGTYLVMEYLRGMDLQETLRAGEERGGHMKPPYLVNLLRPVVATLKLAHEQGIVHRDLKPSNIFVLDKSVGRGVRLLDFGLVKLLNAKSITDQGQVAGTPSYMAPEVWKGNPLELDHRIDVYALGVVVYRALAGRVPYKGKGMVRMLEWALSGERPGLRQFRPELDPNIDVWVQRALCIDPDKRFQSVIELWSHLESVLGTASGAPF